MPEIDDLLSTIMSEVDSNNTIVQIQNTSDNTNEDVVSDIIDSMPVDTEELITTVEEEQIEEPVEEFEEEIEEQENPIQETINEVIEASKNSESLLVDDFTARFKGAPWYDIVKEQVVILAGLGGIGSYVNFYLARMKPKALYLYDGDIVEAVNMSGQLYGSNTFGKTKVMAAKDFANIMADYYDVFGSRRLYEESSEATNIMICGFDNMKARKVFYNNWKKYVESLDILSRSRCLYIDGRLAAESMQVFCITGNDGMAKSIYENEWLFSDSEADTTVCSYKQTTYCAAMIGAIITNLFVNFCTNLGDPVFERALPFLTTYEADIMQFKAI